MSNVETFEALVKAGATLAIPIVLAVFGYRIQQQIADQGLAKDYVQIAATILKDDPKSQQPEVRTWAVSVLSQYSPIAFSPKVTQGLQAGVHVSGLPLQPPPAECMKVTRPSQIQAKLLKVKGNPPITDTEVNALLKMLPDDLYQYDLAQTRLNCLQNWLKSEQNIDDKYRASIGAPSSASEVEAIRRMTPPASQASSATH